MKYAMAEMAANGRPTLFTRSCFTDGAEHLERRRRPRRRSRVPAPCRHDGRAAAAAGYTVYTIAYGADENCQYEDPGSPWANQPADDVIEAMASDPANFLDAPRTSDLDPIFEAIGAELAGGSKLVR
jgi:hypothetical protein